MINDQVGSSFHMNQIKMDMKGINNSCLHYSREDLRFVTEIQIWGKYKSRERLSFQIYFYYINYISCNVVSLNK